MKYNFFWFQINNIFLWRGNNNLLISMKDIRVILNSSVFRRLVFEKFCNSYVSINKIYLFEKYWVVECSNITNISNFEGQMQVMMKPRHTSITQHVKEGKLVLVFVPTKKHAWSNTFWIKYLFDLSPVTRSSIANNTWALKKLWLIWIHSMIWRYKSIPQFGC